MQQFAVAEHIPLYVREGHGVQQITYRNGAFRLNKMAAQLAGFPERVDIRHNIRTNEVLLIPTDEANPESHKLSRVGYTSWGNSFTSHELARRLGLPENETVYFDVEWDSVHHGLRFRA